VRHPFQLLDRFPTVFAPPGHWRVVKAGHLETPWWFGHDGDNRFDLHPESEDGTCYLADDEDAALLELVLRDAEPPAEPGREPPIAPAEVANLRLALVRLPAAWECADVTGAADGLDELLTSASHELPQQWAQAFHAADLEGIRYVLRHGGGRLGTAVFGRYGARVGVAEAVERITPSGVGAWRQGKGPVVEAPHSSDLRWLDARGD
jgi:RES domain